MKKIFIILCVAVFLGMIPQAYALTIPPPADTFYLGNIVDGIPSSETAEAGYINNLITLAAGASETTIGTEKYNRLNSTLAGPFPTATATGAIKDEEDTNPDFDNIFNAGGMSYQYVLAKYDASNPGAGSFVWYSATGFTGDFTVPNSSPGGYGLSHITVFNGTYVPEPATMFFLAVGLLGLAGVGRKKFKK